MCVCVCGERDNRQRKIVNRHAMDFGAVDRWAQERAALPLHHFNARAADGRKHMESIGGSVLDIHIS